MISGDQTANHRLKGYRSAHYSRRLVTVAGEIELRVPKLSGATFQTTVIERYRSRETPVKETIVEMYPAGVSTRKIEDVSKLLWGAPVSSRTAHSLNERAFAPIEACTRKAEKMMVESGPMMFGAVRDGSTDG